MLEIAPQYVQETAGQSIERRVTHIRDGDTIEVEGVAVPMAAVAISDVDVDQTDRPG